MTKLIIKAPNKAGTLSIVEAKPTDLTDLFSLNVVLWNDSEEAIRTADTIKVVDKETGRVNMLYTLSNS